MGGWFSASVTTQYENRDEDSSGYGTRTPNISSQYTDAYNNFRSSLNPGGFNATQQGAVDYTQDYLNNGGANARIQPFNNQLSGISTNLNRFTTQGPHLLGAAPTSTAAQAQAAQAEASEAAGVDPIALRTGAQYMDAYRDPYENDVVSSSLAEYDLGAAEARNALRAGSAGAFGNKRTGVAEGQFASDAAIGRGGLVANIRSQGFRDRVGFGQADANRAFQTDATNADNALRNNQFNAGLRTGVSQSNAGLRTGVSQTNAGLTTQNNQFNTGIQNTRDIADQASRYTNDAQQIGALAAQAGLTQQQADNVITADGIDLDAAQNMFTAGTISQAQLEALVDAAAAYNGSSYTDNRSTDTRTIGIGTEVGF